MSDFLTAKEVAAMFKRSPATIRRWARAGGLPCRWLHDRPLFLKEEIDAILEALKRSPGKRFYGFSITDD